MLPVALLAAVVLVLVLISGFFSGAETVYTSVSDAFLHTRAESGDPRAVATRRMLVDTERFLGTTLTGTNLAVVSSTTLAHFIISPYVPGHWQSLVNTLVMTPVLLVLGELLPKSIGRAHADSLALGLIGPLRWASWVLAPLAVLFSRLAGVLVGLIVPGAVGSVFVQVSREDLRAVAELAAEQGLVPETTGSMLRTVFELDEKPISAIMVPLVDVVSVPLTATVADVSRRSVETGFTRFPVFEERVDEIVGIVDLRTLLYDTEVATAAPIERWVQRHIVYVPETKSVATLLHELRYQRIPMAVVVDEHGGVVGILTTEDLVEEVVGEIHDERDRPARKVVEIDEFTYECDGRLDLRELAARVGIEVARDGIETVAGLVLKLAGRIPAVGERFRYEDYDVEVLAVARRRIERVRFARVPPETAAQ